MVFILFFIFCYLSRQEGAEDAEERGSGFKRRRPFTREANRNEEEENKRVMQIANKTRGCHRRPLHVYSILYTYIRHRIIYEKVIQNTPYLFI